MLISLSVHLSVSACLSVCLFVSDSLFICWSVCLPFNQFVCLSGILHVNQSH
jgi:hypothetical protein